MQDTVLLTQNALALSVLNGLLFVVPHLAGPELALGAHAANNVFAFLAVNYD